MTFFRSALLPWSTSPLLLSAMCLLGCVTSVRADPKPLLKDEQAKVDQAIDKGVAFLKRTQTREGDWPRHWPKGYLVGQCALPAYALLEAGVPADDPVVQKAAAFLRPKMLKDDHTYEVSLALLFFDRLGDPKDKQLIQSLSLRLVAGQHRSGGWSYRCLTMSGSNEAALLKSLKELNRRMKDGEKSIRETLRAMDVPRGLRFLTVFQDSDKFDWIEQGSPNLKESLSLTVGTDNSNTQFAMLGLWAAQRHGIPVSPTFRLTVDRFERTQFTDGWWPYGGLPRSEVHHSRSMICVGLIGLAIGSGLKLPTPGAAQPDQERLRILRGLAALYKEIGFSTGQMKTPVAEQDMYFLWSVERVGMVYDLATIGDKDWYHWGVEILVTNQKSRGGWNTAPGYGMTLDTAFALLFLKHSHPMNELTSKLPFRAKALENGIARLLTGDTLPNRTKTAPSQKKAGR